VADLTSAPAEKLLVCVDESACSERIIRFAQHMAARRQSNWSAVYVETPKKLTLSLAERKRAADNLYLAEQLGAETFTLKGRNIADEIIDFARTRRITHIIAGAPGRSIFSSILLRSPVDQLVRRSGEIDVHIINGEAVSRKVRLADYGAGISFLMLATALCFAMFPFFQLSNLIMVYLLAVLVTAIDCGRGPAVLVSLLSVLTFDFCFVPPRFTLTVDDAQYIVTFAVMFVVALVISHLATRLRQEAEIARAQERQAAAMHGLSRQLAGTRGTEPILKAAVQYIAEIFDCRAVALLPDDKGKLSITAGDPTAVIWKDMVKEINLAHSVYSSGRKAGWGTQTSPSTEILCAPLQAADSILGVLALRPNDPRRSLLPRQLNLLESLSKQVALALEVELLTGKCPPKTEPLGSAA
jgi:two-component system sensor histidine kinase KdpD